MELDKLIAGIRSGDIKSLARAISLVENDTEGAQEILEQLTSNDTPVIGVTGPPGAGKGPPGAGRGPEGGCKMGAMSSSPLRAPSRPKRSKFPQ